jgi:hypothetical protein
VSQSPANLFCQLYTDTRIPSEVAAEDVDDHTEDFSAQHWPFGNEVIPCDSMSEPKLPYGSFIGAFLTPNYRIRRFLRTESHGEVYSVECLSHPGTELEAKLYIIKGLSSKLFKYRRRNLKRLELKSCHVETVWQHDRCIVVCYASPCTAAVSEKLGACGRRNTAEFESAFPPLSKTDERNFQHHGYRKTLLLQDLERIFMNSNHVSHVYGSALYHELMSISLIVQTHLEEAGKIYMLSESQQQSGNTLQQISPEQCKPEAGSRIVVRQKTPEKMEQRRLRQISYRQKQKRNRKPQREDCSGL